MLELIIPKLCCACHQKLSAGEEFICTKCRIELPYTYDWYKKDNPAFEILNADYPVEWASSLAFYHKNSNFSRAILNIKFNNQRDCGRELGEIFANELKNSKSIPTDIDLIVPVPLHWAKKAWRGYNQSYHIAHLLKISTQPVGHKSVRQQTLILHRAKNNFFYY